MTAEASHRTAAGVMSEPSAIPQAQLASMHCFGPWFLETSLSCPMSGHPAHPDMQLWHVQGRQSQLRGSPFALVNGATAPEPLCIAVSERVDAPQAIHLLYISTGDCPDLSEAPSTGLLAPPKAH